MSEATTSTVLLVAGNVLAVPFTVYLPGFYRLWRRREPLVFAVEELGMALITTAFLMKGKALPALFNGGWGVGLAVAYGLEGRKRARLADV